MLNVTSLRVARDKIPWTSKPIFIPQDRNTLSGVMAYLREQAKDETQTEYMFVLPKQWNARQEDLVIDVAITLKSLSKQHEELPFVLDWWFLPCLRPRSVLILGIRRLGLIEFMHGEFA